MFSTKWSTAKYFEINLVHFDFLAEQLSAFEVIVCQLLEDVQERLVYKAQVKSSRKSLMLQSECPNLHGYQHPTAECYSIYLLTFLLIFKYFILCIFILDFRRIFVKISKLINLRQAILRILIN